MRKGMFGRVTAAGIVGAVVVLSATAFAALPEGATPLTYIAGSRKNANTGLYLDTGWTLQPNRDVFEAVVEIIDENTTAFWCTRDFPTL